MPFISVMFKCFCHTPVRFCQEKNGSSVNFFPLKLSLIFSVLPTSCKSPKCRHYLKFPFFPLLASLMFKHQSLLHQKNLILNLSSPRRLTLHPANVLMKHHLLCCSIESVLMQSQCLKKKKDMNIHE